MNWNKAVFCSPRFLGGPESRVEIPQSAGVARGRRHDRRARRRPPIDIRGRRSRSLLRGRQRPRRRGVHGGAGAALGAGTLPPRVAPREKSEHGGVGEARRRPPAPAPARKARGHELLSAIFMATPSSSSSVVQFVLTFFPSFVTINGPALFRPATSYVRCAGYFCRRTFLHSRHFVARLVHLENTPWLVRLRLSLFLS